MGVRYRLKILWCWMKHLGRCVHYCWRMLRWGWRKDYFKSYSADRCQIEAEEWVKRQRKIEGRM